MEIIEIIKLQMTVNPDISSEYYNFNGEETHTAHSIKNQFSQHVTETQKIFNLVSWEKCQPVEVLKYICTHEKKSIALIFSSHLYLISVTEAD